MMHKTGIVVSSSCSGINSSNNRRIVEYVMTRMFVNS